MGAFIPVWIAYTPVDDIKISTVFIQYRYRLDINRDIALPRLGASHMSTRLVTKDLVFSAADKLVAEGKQPSQNAILYAIGGGSISTIAPFLKEWRSNAATVKAASAKPLPAGLLRELELLQRQAEDAVRKACDTELLDASDMEQQLIQENGQLQSQVTALLAQLQEAREGATAAQAQLTHFQAEHAALKKELCDERASTAELRIELAKANWRLEENVPRLEQELIACRDQLGTALQAHANAELKAAVSLERVNGLEQRLADVLSN
ncbi:DNA-binding protein [Comamonas sp. CMM02]|uniref:DNA-binding protein n=1 Tax=Comamonas sp. CMM02 TaxID=2769307 RepID=UPI00177D421D|nr:DNA-binding protein [Comamonas sp. CMM02]MBD9400988.1 DNA-binding protein [Comamonas sp. CMM02]